MAKLRFDMEGDLPDELNGLAAAAEDGGYELDLEALSNVGNTKIKEFRTNNIELAEANKALSGQLDTLKDQLAELETARAGESKKVSKAKSDLEERLEALERANKAKDEALAAQTAKVNRQTIHSELSKALTAAGIRPGALGDAIEVAAKGWAVDDDAVKLYSGDNVVYSERDAGEPISPEEFAADWLKARPHFMAESSGDGAQPGAMKVINGRIRVDPNDQQAWSEVVAKVADGKLDMDKVDLIQ